MGVHLAAVDLLQSDVDVCRRRDGVDARFRHGAVAALAVDDDVILLAAGHGDAAVGHQHHAGGQGHPRDHMEHDRRIDLRVFQQAVGQHIRRALEDLLRGLEFQLDGAFQLVLMLLEELGRAQHHGRVHIVAAAVHLAGHLGSEVHTGLLLNGQRVHIAPQQDGLAGALAARQRDDTGLAAVLRSIPHLGQRLFHQRTGLWQVEAHLRVPVQRPPPLLQLGLQHLCLCHPILRGHHSKSAPFFFIWHEQPVEWTVPQSCSSSYCVPPQKRLPAYAVLAKCGH